MLTELIFRMQHFRYYSIASNQRSFTIYFGSTTDRTYLIGLILSDVKTLIVHTRFSLDNTSCCFERCGIKNLETYLFQSNATSCTRCSIPWQIANEGYFSTLEAVQCSLMVDLPTYRTTCNRHFTRPKFRVFVSATSFLPTK